MKLETLLTEICRLGKQDRLINFSAAGGSIYQLNSLTIRNYPILYASPTGTHVAHQNYTTYAITLFYIDRLTEDSSNDVNIHSTGVEVLKNLVRKIEGIDGVVEVADDYTLQLFTETEKMSDRCNGAYATISISVINEDTCGL